MKKLSVALATGAMATVASAQAMPVFYSGTGHYYELVSAGATFDEAMAGAASQSFQNVDGHLVTITSQGEQDFLIDTFGTDILYWMALSDVEVEGTWRYTAGPEAGQVSSYFFWSAGEPNNQGNEDYALGNWNNLTGAWNDGLGGSRISYIVEYSGNAAPVPVPAAALMFGGVAAAYAARRKAKRLA